MRRVRLETLKSTKKCQARRASPPPLSGRGEAASSRSGSIGVAMMFGVLSSTVVCRVACPLNAAAV